MPLPSLPSALARALTERGYTDLTPVQLAVVQPDAEGRDLLVSAKTGSGKTVAYGLALATDLLGDNEQLPPAADPLALIIAPTRELALQVQRELQWLYAPTGARVVSCVGGMDPRTEQRALNAGAHIVVGTPGRLRDHIERNNLRLGGLRAAVLDEADEMLDLGFKEELEAILDAAPAERRTLLFSATLPKPIVSLARQYQRDALRITATSGEQGHSDIDYHAVRIAPSDTEHAVVNLLRFFDPASAIVFCNTREAVRRFHANLVERGFSVVALSGELTQNERTHALQALRDQRAKVCIATDVAARGIDIPNLELVIHAELPNDAQSLQHRSGRTGRAGRKGISAMLIPHPKRRRAEAMLRTANIEATWMGAPTADEIKGRDQERLIEQLRPTEDASEDDIVIARALLASSDPEQVVAALVRARRAALPAAEDLIDNGPEESSRGPSSAPRPGFENTAWFTIDIGRDKNADPRWLLPMICRRGHLTKRDIGAIRIFDKETRFEVVAEAAERFLASVRKVVEPDGVNIVPLADPDIEPARSRKPMRKTHSGMGSRPPYASARDNAGPREYAPRGPRSDNADGPRKSNYAPRLDNHGPGGDAPARTPSTRPEGKPAYGQTSKKQAEKLGGPGGKPFKPKPRRDGKPRGSD